MLLRLLNKTPVVRDVKVSSAASFDVFLFSGFPLQSTSSLLSSETKHAFFNFFIPLSHRAMLPEKPRKDERGRKVCRVELA